MLEQSAHYLTPIFTVYSFCVSLCVCQSPARGRGLCTETVKSGSPACVPDVSALMGKSSVQLKSVSKWPANRWVSGNIVHTFYYVHTGSYKGSVYVPLSLLCSNSISWLAWILKERSGTLRNVCFSLKSTLREEDNIALSNASRVRTHLLSCFNSKSHGNFIYHNHVK